MHISVLPSAGKTTRTIVQEGVVLQILEGTTLHAPRVNPTPNRPAAWSPHPFTTANIIVAFKKEPIVEVKN